MLGDVRGLRLAHPQCHIGLDTLGWARAGAIVTGLDFSPAAIAAARGIAERAGLEDQARFVVADVHDAVRRLGGGAFDIVYVSTGALCWLPSVERWAAQMAGLLAAGGRLYLHDGHPVPNALAEEEATFAASYFEESTPMAGDSDATYTDGERMVASRRTYQWNHGIGEVVTAVLAQGLRLERLVEYDWTDWRRFPWLVRGEDGRWAAPPGRPRLPLSFTLLARRA